MKTKKYKNNVGVPDNKYGSELILPPQLFKVSLLINRLSFLRRIKANTGIILSGKLTDKHNLTTAYSHYKFNYFINFGIDAFPLDL
jgi:hypothetical protein